MDKDNLGTHRGLFQARLEIKKSDVFWPLRSILLTQSFFYLILNMRNSSFHKAIRDYSACWLLVLSPGCSFSIICIFFTLAK